MPSGLPHARTELLQVLSPAPAPPPEFGAPCVALALLPELWAPQRQRGCPVTHLLAPHPPGLSQPVLHPCFRLQDPGSSAGPAPRLAAGPGERLPGPRHVSGALPVPSCCPDGSRCAQGSLALPRLPLHLLSAMAGSPPGEGCWREGTSGALTSHTHSCLRAAACERPGPGSCHQEAGPATCSTPHTRTLGGSPKPSVPSIAGAPARLFPSLRGAPVAESADTGSGAPWGIRGR